MNTPFQSASSQIESSLASPSESRKRPKPSPRRLFSGVARALTTLVLATCALGTVASAQTLTISPPPNSPGGSDTRPGVFEGTSTTDPTIFNFTVTLTGSSADGKDVTVRYATQNGTATGSNGNGTNDFVSVPNSPTNIVTFPGGTAGTQTIPIQVTADSTFENDENFSVVLSNPSTNASLGAQATASATIVDDDNPPLLTVTGPGNVLEGNTGTRNATFTVTLSARSGRDVRFNYSTRVMNPDDAGDGVNGDQDFIPQNNQAGIILAGALSTTINVPVIGDTIDEANGTFELDVTNVDGADLSGNGQAFATIIDDDGPTVTVSDGQANESDGFMTFTITLSKASPQQITVNYRTGSSSARIGLDYGVPGQTTEIMESRVFDAFLGNRSEAGAVSQDITIPIIDDTISEPTEFFNLIIVSADDGNNNGSVKIGRGNAIGTITDNDKNPNLTITQPDPVVEGNINANNRVVFTVTLDSVSSRPTTFSYQTVPGTATSNVDFRNISGNATIPAGQLSTTIATSIIGDVEDEPDETFGLRIFNPGPTGTTIAGAQNNTDGATVFATILDDDGPNITINPTSQEVLEGAANSTKTPAFTVQLSTQSPQDVFVDYVIGSTKPNEATPTGSTSGNVPDYRVEAPFQQSGTLRIPARTTTANIPITIIGDNTNEPNEVVTLTLSAPNGGNLTTTTGTITILNDDDQPTLDLNGPGALREGSSANNNGITNFVFTARLSRASALPVTANFTVNNGSATLEDGTGIGFQNGIGDYRQSTPANTITFPAGTTVARITVPVLADNLDEDDENFSVTLADGPTNANLGVRTAVATILSDDARPTARIAASSALEGNPPAAGQPAQNNTIPLTITLSKPSGRTNVITYQTVGANQGNAQITALAGADFVSISSATVTIPPGATAPVQQPVITINPDTLYEADETVGVKILSSPNAPINGGGSATAIITNDDGPPNIKVNAPTGNNAGGIEPYSLSTDGTNSFPGRSIVFPVTISAAAGRTITANYRVEGTGDNGTDFSDFKNPIGTVTFRPDNNSGTTTTTQNIVLNPRGDDGNEADVENFNVVITTNDANFAAQADTTAAGTLADRDPSLSTFAPTVGFGTYNGVRGTTVTFTGTQFVTDNIPRVASIRFSGPVTNSTVSIQNPRGNATTITVVIPGEAYSNFPALVLSSGRVLTATDDATAGALLYVQPTVLDFSPRSGVPEVTRVVITGRHFRDPRNPVVAVRFGGTVVTPENTGGRGYTINSDTEIIAYVPNNSAGGPISIETQFGGTGPGSVQGFTINGFNTGGLQFIGANTSAVYEGATATIDNRTGGILQSVRSFTLRLKAATQDNGNNQPLAPRRDFEIVVSLTPSGGDSVSLPVVQLDRRNPAAVTGLEVVRESNNSNSTVIRVKAQRDPTLNIPLIILAAGSDSNPPTPTNRVAITDFETGITPPVPGSGFNLTLRAEITNTRDPLLYPNGQAAELTFERRDIHSFNTDTGTIYRTTEDPNAPDHVAQFRIDLANTRFPNPGLDQSTSPRAINPINTDAIPATDVNVRFQTSDASEGLITYYVINRNGVKVYPIGSTPQTSIEVLYATDPKRDEYYGNAHYVQVIGQDDDVSDPDTSRYQINAVASSSTDLEYNNNNLQLAFRFVNTDNEQTDDGNGNVGNPGYGFSRTQLNTSEDGSTDFFSTFLRTQPTSNVVVQFTSDKPNEVVFVNPNNPNGTGLSSINVTYLRTGTGNPNNFTTNWRTPLTITVRGVDDDLVDGNQQVRIFTRVVTASTADPTYRGIDPPNLTDTNTDNESNAVAVTPRRITLNENATGEFTVRLNSEPTADVSISLSSSDTGSVILTGSTELTFNRINYRTPQRVTFRTVSDGTFTAQRTATIVTANANSDDDRYDGLVVDDVIVTINNNEPAFVVSTTTVRTGENGTNDSFTVALSQAPEEGSNVTLNLAVSPSTEARLSRSGGASATSLSLVFTSANFATPQTVNVIGQDDSVADGDATFTITGRVTTQDPTYQGQSFTPITGINVDNESGTGGGNGTTVFGTNSTYTISVPYASTSAANSTIPISSLFTPASATNFKIYRFNVSGQQNSRVIGEDFVLVPNSGSIQRGIGYILQTTNTQLTLRSPATSSAVKAFTGTTFSFALGRNNNFTIPNGTPSGSKAESGYNFIGFPFNPAQFTRANFASAQVAVGNSTYPTVREAAAAGVISDSLYTLDSSGNLVKVADDDQYIRAYKAYFVKVYRDGVTLTFRSPSN